MTGKHRDDGFRPATHGQPAAKENFEVELKNLVDQYTIKPGTLKKVEAQVAVLDKLIELQKSALEAQEVKAEVLLETAAENLNEKISQIHELVKTNELSGPKFLFLSGVTFENLPTKVENLLRQIQREQQQIIIALTTHYKFLIEQENQFDNDLAYLQSKHRVIKVSIDKEKMFPELSIPKTEQTPRIVYQAKSVDNKKAGKKLPPIDKKAEERLFDSISSTAPTAADSKATKAANKARREELYRAVETPVKAQDKKAPSSPSSAGVKFPNIGKTTSFPASAQPGREDIAERKKGIRTNIVSGGSVFRQAGSAMTGQGQGTVTNKEAPKKSKP